MMNLWKGVKLNDIPEEQRDFVELVELETLRKLIEIYVGSSIYIYKKESILQKKGMKKL